MSRPTPGMTRTTKKHLLHSRTRAVRRSKSNCCGKDRMTPQHRRNRKGRGYNGGCLMGLLSEIKPPLPA